MNQENETQMIGNYTGPQTANGLDPSERIDSPQSQRMPLGDRDRFRGVAIRTLNKGFILSVGCQEFAIKDVEDLLSYLNMYYKEPEATEAKFFAGTLFF